LFEHLDVVICFQSLSISLESRFSARFLRIALKPIAIDDQMRTSVRIFGLRPWPCIYMHVSINSNDGELRADLA